MALLQEHQPNGPRGQGTEHRITRKLVGGHLGNPTPQHVWVLGRAARDYFSSSRPRATPSPTAALSSRSPRSCLTSPQDQLPPASGWRTRPNSHARGRKARKWRSKDHRPPNAQCSLDTAHSPTQAQTQGWWQRSRSLKAAGPVRCQDCRTPRAGKAAV